MQQLATITGWAYKEIMEEVPFSAGLQLIDSDLYQKGVERVYTNETPNFDSRSLIDKAFSKIQ